MSKDSKPRAEMICWYCGKPARPKRDKESAIVRQRARIDRLTEKIGALMTARADAEERLAALLLLNTAGRDLDK